MMTLEECPVCKTVKRPHRVARASAAHAPAGRAVARPLSCPSPLHSRRVRCESDEALSIALDRMINEILRERAATNPNRKPLP